MLKFLWTIIFATRQLELGIVAGRHRSFRRMNPYLKAYTKILYERHLNKYILHNYADEVQRSGSILLLVTVSFNDITNTSNKVNVFMFVAELLNFSQNL